MLTDVTAASSPKVVTWKRVTGSRTADLSSPSSNCSTTMPPDHILTTTKHPFNGPFPGLPRWASTRKVKPTWILLKQETVSEWQWHQLGNMQVSRQITRRTPHHSVFLQAGCPSWRPTNSVKALKADHILNSHYITVTFLLHDGVGCWHSCLSGARCILAYGSADATATHCLLLH